MKKITRRNFLGRSLAGSAAVVAFPSVIENLAETGVLESKADKAEVPSEALQYISSVSLDGKYVHVRGWNDDGFFCYSHKLNTGEIYFSYHIDFRNMPMVKDEKQRTLTQLRADGVTWGEIDKLNPMNIYTFVVSQ